MNISDTRARLNEAKKSVEDAEKLCARLRNELVAARRRSEDARSEQIKAQIIYMELLQHAVKQDKP